MMTKHASSRVKQAFFEVKKTSWGDRIMDRL